MTICCAAVTPNIYLGLLPLIHALPFWNCTLSIGSYPFHFQEPVLPDTSPIFLLGQLVSDLPDGIF